MCSSFLESSVTKDPISAKSISSFKSFVIVQFCTLAFAWLCLASSKHSTILRFRFTEFAHISSDLNKNSRCWKPRFMHVCKDGTDSNSDDDDGNICDDDGDCRHWMHWIRRTSLRFVCSLSHQSSFRLSWRQSVFFSTDRKQTMISLSYLISPSYSICCQWFVHYKRENWILCYYNPAPKSVFIFSLHNTKF